MNKLSPGALRKEIDPETMHCRTTEELSPLEGIIGQERAVRALKFGLDIKEHGFNIYVAGPPGTGKETAVKDFLEELAKKRPVPSDWCYVNNVETPYEPKAIELPPGKGKQFQEDIATLIAEVRRVLPETFQSEEYGAKREETIKKIEEERNELLSNLTKKAQEQGFILQTSPVGLLTIPVMDGNPLSDEEFMKLGPERKEEIQKKREELTKELRNTMRKLQGLQKKMNEAIKNLNQEVALYAIGHLIEGVKETYEQISDIIMYLEQVQNDIVENIEQFIQKPEKPSLPIPAPWLEELPFRKYEVNLITDNSELEGSPVIIEQNPTYQNLFGRIEKEAQFGVLTTDFTMIRGGSLHKANGGYLVLPVEELLRNMFSWDGLKRDLMNQRITIEEAAERLGYMTTKGLRPQPIPLDIKVVLLGNPLVYHILYSADPHFKELFKVKADFDTVMDRTEENIKKYASFICTLCQKEDLKHLDASAIAKVIAYGSRLVADQEKLSTRFADVADIIREANFYAVQEGTKYVRSNHIEKAIEEKVYRSNLIQERIKEMIERGVILIDTEGKTPGQVNGLSVISLGDFSFGRPSRLTASVGLGREGIIDIEREAQLGGRIHAKGVMILSGYLNQKYAQDKPLSLNARLVFEQSYEGVEGDSASSTELYAILSALSGLPVNQNIAVTGSVNQKGEVQAIGGVNEKIEGFFEVCRTNGLSGNQGVIIPESNVQNLMLKEEVVEAVEAKKFHIYPVKTIDEGIEILSGVKAGERKDDGTFEEDTVNYLVDNRLREMAEKLREFPEFVGGKR
ncbi:MAG: AAA family ATPase [Theionarchaea archaeon]|nr:MAG: ATP-dependent protease [Theionarchaea archaeon DG-70]MBU7011582.1 AAA family ATPase [Theionarchaea archaeon]